MSLPGGRKRTATSPPTSTSERSTKRSRLSVNDEETLEDNSERRSKLKIHTRFPLPLRPEELSESKLATALNGEENPDPVNIDESRIRRLSNFTFFYADAARTDGFRDIVGLDKLRRNDGSTNGRIISAYGGARMDDADLDEAAFEGGVEGEDNPENPGPAPLQFEYFEVILDSVEAWWIGNGVSNADMYIRTDSAWYLLEEPSEFYCKAFAPFWIPHRLSQVIADYALRHPTKTYEHFTDFLGIISDESNKMVGRAITANDVALRRAVIQDDLERTTLLPSLRETEIIKKLYEIRAVSPPSARSPRPPPGAEGLISKIFVTPLVYSITQRYFKSRLESIGGKPKHFPQTPQVRRKDPVITVPLKLGKDEPDDGSIKYYPSIVFEEEHHYKIGDFVATVIGKHSELEARPQPLPLSSNRLANNLWFGLIHRLFTTYEPKHHPPLRYWAHIQWFDHGLATDLGELAGPNELFETYNCSDVGLAGIKQLINVQMVKCDSSKIIPLSDTAGLKEDHFFCRFTFNNDDGSFHDLSQPKPFELAPRDGSKLTSRLIECPVCDARVSYSREEGAVSPLEKSPEGKVLSVLFKNTPYHLNDTILYFDDDDGVDGTPNPRQLIVGLVQGWSLDPRKTSSNVCTIRKLAFRDELVKRDTFATTVLPIPTAIPLDERCLYLTRDIVKIAIKNIERHCVVHQPRKWQGHPRLGSEPDHFFLTHSTKSFNPTINDLKPIQSHLLFNHCEICTARAKNWKEFREPYKRIANGRNAHQGLGSVNTLRTLDLCAGAGGLSLGLQKSGLFSVCWAVENDVQPARSYKSNFPQANMFTQDLNLCAKNALSPEGNREEIKSLDLAAANAPKHMPLRGEVDAIFAGPPCPDFSIQNIHRDKAGESNTGLVLTALSMVDFYRPQFVLVENVPGMLRHEAVDQETGKIVEFAMVKVILRVLTAIGYSVRWGLFNSANYGAPQLRTRIVFYGSRGGYRLPEIPLPSHMTYSNPRVAFTRFTGAATKMTESFAAFPHVSLAASIGDLPAFEWKVDDPVINIPQRPQVPAFLGESERGAGLAGFTGEGVKYASAAPATLYQARARSRVDAEDEVTLHFTRTFAIGRSKKAERVISVPLLAKADHRKIPRELDDWAHSNALSAAARTQWAPGRYGRLDWQGQFQTAITRIDPTAKQGRVLHPSQRRILSLREAARSQGFPDHFIFVGDAKSVIRQIGNAVPIQLGEAFGRVFRDAVICHRVWHELGVKWPEWPLQHEEEEHRRSRVELGVSRV